jgi:type I restriction enzyme, S subunit
MISKKVEKELDKILNSIEEPPYKIPKNWVWIALKHLGEINPKNTDITDDTEVSFVPMASVDDVTGEYKGEETKKWGEVKRGYTHMANGDVIFAKITPCMENGKCAVVKDLKNGYGAGSTEFHVIRPYKCVLPEYIHLFLRQESFRKYAEENMTGSAGQKRVPTKWFKEQMIPIPPIQEQRRIVEKVKKSFEKIDVIMENLSKAKELLKKRHEALLQKAFRGELVHQEINNDSVNQLSEIAKEDTPYELPKNWVWIYMKDVIDLISGSHIKSDLYSDNPCDGIPYFTGPSDFSGETTNATKFSKSGTSKCNKGDILITVKGSGLGTVAIANTDAYIGRQLMAIRPKEMLSPKYLFYWLKYSQKDIKRLATGIAIPGISRNDILGMVLPLPPISEQDRIVNRLENEFNKQREILETIKKSEEKLKKMRQSLLQKAFRGELVEQCPEEGTGLDLLKEIIEEKLKLNKEK